MHINLPYHTGRFVAFVSAHPNTRLFITHAGLLSTQEAIYHGVPVVAVPIFGDQDTNAVRITEAGIGIMLEILGATEEIIEKAVREALENNRQDTICRTM